MIVAPREIELDDETPGGESIAVGLDEQVLERRLIKLRLSGPDLSHTRRNNLDAVRRMVAGDPYTTFGIARVLEHMRREVMEVDEALKIVASVTKCSQDIAYTEGRGYISPHSTINGLKATAIALRKVSTQGGRVVFATGHPGSMIEYYSALAALVRRMGGRVLDLARGQIVEQGADLDHVKVADSTGGVAFLSDTCGALHTHDSRPMAVMLDDEGEMPDLVVADHGFAGEALNRGITTVAVMDTNDPGLAMAKTLGADLTLVPMNDNRPNVVTREAAEIVERMMLESARGAVLAR